MKLLFTAPRNRILPAGAALAAAIALLAPCAAQATPYVLKLVQQGSNVVAIGSGAFDLSGLANRDGGPGPGYATYAAIQPSQGYLSVGLNPSWSLIFDGYSGLTGPAAFGSGDAQTPETSNAGDPVTIFGSFNGGFLFVPHGYVSDAALSSSASWDNASLASLGVAPGTYTWIWGTGADQSFTLDAFKSVPEPAALGMFGFGTLLLGAFTGLRRRAA